MRKETDKSGKFKAIVHKVGTLFSKGVDTFEVTILVVSTAALAVLLIINVVMRNLYRSIHFAEEVSRLLVILITFIGTSYAARKARHIRMGALLELLPQKVEKVLILIISVISAAVMLILGIIALQYVMVLFERQTVTSSLRAPYWTFVLIAPIGLFMSSFQYIRTIIKNLQEEDVWLSPEQKDEFEDEEVILERAKASIDLDSIHVGEKK